MYPVMVSFENESSVNKLNKDLFETIALLKRLGADTNGLEKVQHQLYVLNLFADRQIISIAGLQSVGKTSLIKRFLDFPEDLLVSEVGVGEKRPVLISVDESLTAPAYYNVTSSTKVNGYIDIALQSISKEALNEGVQNPSSDTLWFEIKLPKNDKIGPLTIALLPGFERNKQSDSQMFLDLFLNCSTGMILVLNHMRLAQASQHELLKKVSKTYKEKAPGFVLTFANELEEENRATIKANLMEQFHMEQDDQIVFSDFTDETVPAKLEKLMKQNSKYALNSASLHVKQQLVIGEQLSMHLTKAEQSIKSKYLADQERNNFSYNQRLFTQYKEDYIKVVREILQTQMNAHVEGRLKEVTESLKNEKDSKIKKLKSFFKNDLTYKEVQELKEWVEKVYTTEDPYKTNTILINAIGQASDSYLHKRLPSIVKSIEGGNNNTSSALLANNSNEFGDFGDFEIAVTTSNEFGSLDDFAVSAVSKQVEPANIPSVQELSKEEQLNFVMNHTLTIVDKFVNLKEDDFKGLKKEELQVIPALAGGIVQQAIATKTLMDRNNINDLTQLQVFNQQQNGIDLVKGEINQLSMDMDQIVKGSMIFFGIDALDGTFNSFGAITGALKALGLGAGAATGVAIAGVGALGAAVAIKKGGDKLEKYKFEREQYATNLMRLSSEYQVEATVKSIETIFEDMEFKLEMAQNYREDVQGNLPAYNEAQIRIGRLQKECGTLRELAYRNETFIGKLSASTI